MTTVLGVLVAGFLAVLVLGLVSGRVPWRQSGCCAPADPACDARLRTASGSDALGRPQRRQPGREVSRGE